MTTGADVAIAIGTIATAVLALVGLAVTVYVNKKDRDQAATQASTDRQAAARVAAEDRAAARQDAQRRHIVDLLLELGREVARHAAYANMPQSSEAAQQIQMLLMALPGECATTVRKKFRADRNMQMPGAVGEKAQHLDVGSSVDPTTEQMSREIAFDIDRYMTSGHAPDDVWNDLDDLKRWERERWPR